MVLRKEISHQTLACVLTSKILAICRKSIPYSRNITLNVRQPFENFVDSPYYSESEHCGGEMTVSFSKYLSWQAMHFLQRSTYFSKTCCRPSAVSFRRMWSSLLMTVKAQKSHGARSGLYGGCSNGVAPISVSASLATFQSRNADGPLRKYLVVRPC
jgi:hypothetical protein